MKLERLIGILSILLQRDRVTAPFLAETFEVSRRTIGRDIDALCRAGIPICTSQGAGGGISIMPGYRVDRSLLTRADMAAILAGLKSLDSVSGSNRYSQLMEKLQLGGESGSMLIDLASWYRGPLTDKIGLLSTALDQKQMVSFYYYAPSGEGERQVEPYYLMFQWGDWYLYAFCRKREDYRLFKLRRMTRLRLKGPFSPRQTEYPDLSDDRVFPENYQVELIVPARWKWRLVENYGEKCYTDEPDGRCRSVIGFTNLNAALDWVMGFCGEAELLGPKKVIDAAREIGGRLLGQEPKGAEDTNETGGTGRYG